MPHPRGVPVRQRAAAAGDGSDGNDGGGGNADVDAGGEDDGGAGGDDMDDISRELSDFPAMRRRFEAMQRELDIRAGVRRPLQAELDEVRSGPLGSAASDGPLEVVATDMLPPPPRAPAMSAHLQQMAEKEDMRAWRHAANHKRWFVTGRRLVEPTVPRHGVQAVLQDIVEVASASTSFNSPRPATRRAPSTFLYWIGSTFSYAP